jgi:hypothetical protein
MSTNSSRSLIKGALKNLAFMEAYDHLQAGAERVEAIKGYDNGAL